MVINIEAAKISVVGLGKLTVNPAKSAGKHENFFVFITYYKYDLNK